jgi:serine/threonine protein kinase
VRLDPGLQAIPGHRLSRLLGRGAFGEVWEALDAQGRPVALKFMDCRTKSHSLISSEIRVLRALRELQHPHIIEFQGVYASAQYVILSMERADGNLDDLRQAYLEETGQNILPEHLLELLEQAATALDFLAGVQLPGFNLASRGVQHCDIKPSNLLLVGDRLKVADFGLCAGTSWQTHRNAWKGTPPYAAPELFRGQATIGTDQYALAVTYCAMVAGARMLAQGTATADGPPLMPVDMSKVRRNEIPVLARALHPQPACRYPSCRAFVAALRAAIQRPRPAGQRGSERTPLKRRAH